MTYFIVLCLVFILVKLMYEDYCDYLWHMLEEDHRV